MHPLHKKWRRSQRTLDPHATQGNDDKLRFRQTTDVACFSPKRCLTSTHSSPSFVFLPKTAIRKSKIANQKSKILSSPVGKFFTFGYCLFFGPVVHLRSISGRLVLMQT